MGHAHQRHVTSVRARSTLAAGTRVTSDICTDTNVMQTICMHADEQMQCRHSRLIISMHIAQYMHYFMLCIMEGL